MRLFTSLSFVPVFLLAGNVLAQFQVMLDGVTKSDFRNVINIPAESPPVMNCQAQCSAPFQTIMMCGMGANDAQCFCTPELLSTLTTCEQCMLNFLVATNTRPVSPLIGLNSIITSFQGACTAANMTLPKTALAVAPNWDGPFGVGLNLPLTIVVVGTGFFMGSSFLYTLATVE